MNRPNNPPQYYYTLGQEHSRVSHLLGEAALDKISPPAKRAELFRHSEYQQGWLRGTELAEREVVEQKALNDQRMKLRARIEEGVYKQMRSFGFDPGYLADKDIPRYVRCMPAAVAQAISEVVSVG